jgi:hypothetical protein
MTIAINVEIQKLIFLLAKKYISRLLIIRPTNEIVINERYSVTFEHFHLEISQDGSKNN